MSGAEVLVSDEADELVVALLAKERLDRSTGKALTLEDSMHLLSSQFGGVCSSDGHDGSRSLG